MKLTGKVFIKGAIVTQTGLHIGGSKASLDIGGVDLNVIKTPSGVPFIPGSSLKGKLRSMLARIYGSEGISKRDVDASRGEKSDEDFKEICEIFGLPGDEKNSRAYKTRLIVRDADFDEVHFDNEFTSTGAEMELPYTDVKWENTINRKTGTAEHPRQLERVPAGVKFNFELVYDVYDDGKKDGHLSEIRMAMLLLEGDYLGGQGSRGYGKIKFEDVTFTERTFEQYKSNEPATLLESISF